MAPAQRGADSVKRNQVSFTLSGPSSAASSRTSSPAPTPPTSFREEYLLEKVPLNDAGCRPMDVYDATLPAWRAADAIRTPFLDSYFVYSSALGTHTFFMTFLPMLFFFGYPELGRGLIVVLCLGIYFTSVVKDLFCSPPTYYVPTLKSTPAIGTHHLEYGMPSTHSANAVSLALFFWAYIHELALPPAPIVPSVSFPAYVAFTISLAVYATSIVFGRLYTAMHSFSDCAVGVFLGAFLWLAHTSFPGISLSLPLPSALTAALHLPASYTYTPTLFRGWGWGALLDAWVLRTPSSLRVPFTLIPLALLAVNQHPQPVDDCPCFEDAIALGSVVLGMFVGRWGAVRWGAHVPGPGVVMPGSGWVLSSDGWETVERGWGDAGVWWAAALAKMTFGILVIFAWRLVAKAALHRALPPTFRFLATLMRLPNRRFYTPATDYTSVPPLDALRPIPSVIDLPSTAGVEVGGIGSGSGISNGTGNGKGGLRRRAEAVEAARGGGAHVQESEAALDGEGGEVKHYDADVLTKLIVYAGIAVIACEVMPVLFEKFGWGVRSWP
ncbi:Sphingosine-1-phosphate phosphatase [Mycena venus]|uniref:Sphingosine-1-phosphate phosphatase n=1 Tax=Mycena venus TaxID=2733690 RepID=A0A8H7CSJ6_9AGAR|nr:Sphingosine-1-phosphate phosphatase [Mycena venus]